MKRDLSQQRCRNHAQREAVARCPGCGHYFCRECITEHEDQVRCAECLGKAARRPLLQRRGFASARYALQCLLGLMVAWFFFHLLGELLLALPSSFHEGTIWSAEK